MTKIKKTLLWVFIGFVLFNAQLLWEKFFFGKPNYYVEAPLYKQGDSQTFEFKNNEGIKEIGFFVYSNELFNGFHEIDGNYTLNYYLDNQLIHTTESTIQSLSKSKYKSVIMSTSSNYSLIPLDVNDFVFNSLQITVNKPHSDFKNINGNLHVYFQKYTPPPVSFETSPEEKLRNSRITDLETNTTLMPLRKALDSKDVADVLAILKRDNNITIHTPMIHNKSILHFSAFNNDMNMTKTLITLGANIEHKDKLGKTALAYAIENNATQTIQLLFKHNASLKEVTFVNHYLPTYDHTRGWYATNSKIKPLEYAISIGSVKLTDILLAHDKKMGGKELTYSPNSFLCLTDIPNYINILSILTKYQLHFPKWMTEERINRELEYCAAREEYQCNTFNLPHGWREDLLKSYFYMRQEQEKRRQYDIYINNQKTDNSENTPTSLSRPDYTSNSSTLRGIDTNKNNIRDDLEYYFLRENVTKTQQQLNNQFARAYQNIILDKEYLQHAHSHKKVLFNAYSCKLYINKNHSNLKLWKNDYSDRIKKITFDTLERRTIQWNWEQKLGKTRFPYGKTYPNKDACDFNITKTLEQDTGFFSHLFQ